MQLVSVIIPNYNHSKYLRERIESVLNQDYANIEVIILDDCSTDDSQLVIERYRHDNRVKQVVYNSVNSGSPFKQWNKGVGLAAGNYVWIAESDDYADPAFLTHCMQKFGENPSVVLVYTDSIEVNEADAQLGRWSRWQLQLKPNLWVADFVIDGKTLNASYNQVANVIPNASSVVFKKDVYLQSPYKETIETLKCTGDWLMWFSILETHDVCYHHQPLNYFRYHTNTTRANPETRLCNVQEQYWMLAFFRKFYPVTDKELEQRKLAEVFASWNLPLRRILSPGNRKTLRLAMAADKRLFSRIAQTLLRKLR